MPMIESGIMSEELEGIRGFNKENSRRENRD